MFPGGNGNADLGYNKHPHAHGHGHGHSHNQFLAQPPPPPPHFSLPPGGGPGIVNPLVATSLPLGMQGSAGIDWAQLAQQWIHMRDAGPAAVSMPVSACPPPPVIGNVRDYHHPQQTLALPLTSVVRAGYPGVLEEHGEADMDMDDDNERGHGAETPPPPAPVVTQSQWLTVSEPPALSVPASSDAAVTLGKQQWSSNWHTQPGKAATATGNPTAHIPSLLKINVSNPNEPHQQLQLQPPQQQPTQPHHQPATHQQQSQQPQQHQQHQHLESGGSGGGASSELDANKRKMLPAWIREGLEKMEREKQRQLERQQSSSQVPSDMTDAAVDVHVKQVSSKTLTTPVNLLNIASVASDSEDSIGQPAGVELGVGVGGELKEQQIGNELLSKATTDGTSDSSDDDDQQEKEQRREREDVVKATVSVKDDDVNGKNYEDRLADLMLVVRRTLTEILLETTNEEIAAIAGETLKAHRAKASSAQVIRKSALSSITGNLGLAAYGDSSSESEEDEDEEDGERQADAAKDLDKSVHLSAEELKARIRRSKRSFERVIDDIEDRVAKQEHRDEQTLQRHRKRELERSDNAGEQRRPLTTHPESLGETASRGQPTHEKLQQYNGKRPSRKERTTRFSDNKDGKQQSSQSYVQQVVATVATVAPPASLSSSSVPAKLKPVPNVATNLLQMPESVATMLSAADKALNKANKSSSRMPKSKRRHSSTSSSTSSSDSSSSSSSNSDDSSSSTSGGSKTSSSRSKRSSRHGHRSQHGGSSSTSRSKYDRRDRHRERERDRDRDRERERDRRHDRHHYSGASNSSHRQSQRQQRHRGSSHSAEDDGGGHHRSSRPSSSRSHDHGSSTSGRKRHRTRSRSKSRSTHHSSSNAYTSSSSASHSRKRH